MSYCVNCGVELDKSATKCALCSAPVINPFEPEPVAAMPYSERLEIPSGVRRKYVSFIITIVLLIPNIVCLLINFLFPSSGIWSIYVASSSILFWILFILPFIIECKSGSRAESRSKKLYPHTLISLDTAATLLYVFVFYMAKHGSGWYLPVAVPMILLLFAGVEFLAIWSQQKKREWPSVSIAVFSEIGIYSLCSGYLIDRYTSTATAFEVALIILLSCASLIVFFSAVAHSKRFRAWLSRKFFV